MEKGQTNNPNGRPKGTPNKITTTVRYWLLGVINDNREQLQDDLQKLEPKERVEVILKLLPYILPKVESATDVEGAAYSRSDVISKEIFGDWETTKNVLKQWYDKPQLKQCVED